MMSVSKRLRAISRAVFLGTVFLVPVLVLPWTTDIFETNKQAVLMLGMGVSASCLMISLLLDKHPLARPSSIFLVPAVVFVASLLSAVSSVAPMTSWIGQGAQEYASVLSLAGLLPTCFLAVIFTRTPNERRDVLLAIFSSSALASLVFIPIFLGLKTGLFSNLIGAPHAFGVYLLVASTLACGLWLTAYVPVELWAQRWLRASTAITFFVTLVVMLALDSTTIWALAIISCLSLFIVALVHADKFQNTLRFVPSMTIFILALIFLILPTSFPSPFLQEVSPNAVTTWGVIRGAWQEGSMTLGSGPGTFALVYPKYADQAINDSEFWDLIFDRGNAYITTQLATVGLLGVLAWLVFVGGLLILGVKKLTAVGDDWKDVVPVLAAWLVMVVAMCVYSQNLTLATIFWLLSGTLLGLLVPRNHVSSHHQARARLATVFVTVCVLVAFTTMLLLTVPRYLAEIAFVKAVKMNTEADSAASLDEVIRLLDKASTANPWNDTYTRNLAGALLRRLSVLSSDEAADSEYVQSLIMTLLEVSDRATSLSPANVLNWEVRGLMYRELLPVLPEAAGPSIDAFKKAVALAPVNPKYRVQLARSYLAEADSALPLLSSDDADVASQAEAVQVTAFEQAEAQLIAAVDLKGDYAPAHYYLALLRQRQGNLAEAVRGLMFVRDQAPQDVGVGLQLGLLYLRQGKNDLAQAEFERVLELAPAYADAHWYLSVVFEQQDDLPRAIIEVEQVLATNPDNVTVQSRLNRLKAGQTSDIIPDPVSLPSP